MGKESKKKSKKNSTKTKKSELRAAIEALGAVDIEEFFLKGHGKSGPLGILGYKAKAVLNGSTIEGGGESRKQALKNLLSAATVAAKAFGAPEAEPDASVQPGAVGGPLQPGGPIPSLPSWEQDQTVTGG